SEWAVGKEGAQAPILIWIVVGRPNRREGPGGVGTPPAVHRDRPSGRTRPAHRPGGVAQAESARARWYRRFSPRVTVAWRHHAIVGRDPESARHSARDANAGDRCASGPGLAGLDALAGFAGGPRR